MFKITERVNASSIWEKAKDFVDEGARPGILRGYNIEVKNKDGAVDWMSCSYTHEEPEVHFSSEFYQDYLLWLDCTPTGRICFRGYYVEVEDEEGEYLIDVDKDGNRI